LTTVEVLKEPGRAADTTSYMWLYRTGRDGPPIIVYDYQTTRASKHPRNFLKGFKGYLQVDAYEGYNGMNEITLVACWSHARRYFCDAIKAMPKTQKNRPTVAEEGLEYCNRLYDIEDEWKDAASEERYKGRLERSRPVLDEFPKWLKYQAPRETPKSVLGKAIQSNIAATSGIN